MVKLYYTDPLAAAYMAREFGVKFANNNSDSPARMDIITTFSSMDNHVSTIVDCCGIEVDLSDNEEIYIHPDSLHIFEPMDGDIGLDTHRIANHFEDGDWTQLGYRGLPNHPVKIIRRNNKPFHWPEEEPY